MPIEITMPQLSDTMTEGTLVKWNKAEGDKVKAGEEIADIETDKATMPMESFEAGTLAHIAVPEGGKVAVGQVIAFLATARENPADVKRQVTGGAAASPAPKAAPAQKPQPVQASRAGSSSVSSGGAVGTLEAASASEIHEPDHVGHGATREHASPVPPIPPNSGNGKPRTFVSPLARRIAADRNIDLSTLTGSGPGGRIVKQDVLNAPAAKAPEIEPKPTAIAKQVAVQATAVSVASLPARLSPGGTRVIPLTKMRATIAQRLQQSKQQIPHFYETIDIDVEECLALRQRMNTQLEKEKIRLSLADFISKSVASALTMHPMLNATFNGTEITQHSDVNLGQAVAIDDGLIVPVLRGINYMGLKEIRVRSADLIDRARAQRLKREELSGGTFTISSLGTFGVREFSAIINPPEVGILAIGAAAKRPAVIGDAIVPRMMMTVTLSCDHRVADGATAAGFLATLKQLLEEPGMMLV